MAKANGSRVHGPVLSPVDPIGDAAAAALQFYSRVFAGEEAGARRGDVPAVHHLRVATRRLRSVLRLFGPVLPADGVRRAGEDLAWLGRAIGNVRDLDVLLLALPARSRRLPRADRDALAALEVVLRARRADAHAALVQTLDTPRCRQLIARLATRGGTGPSTPLGDGAAELVAPLLRAVHRAGRRLDADASAEKFHRLRVRVKRLRYALETLHTLGGPHLVRMVRRLEEMQELLGRHQDSAEQAARLRELADSSELPPATLMAIGGLIQVLAWRGRRSRRRFASHWRRLDRRRLRHGVRDELGRHRGGGRILRVVRRTGT